MQGSGGKDISTCVGVFYVNPAVFAVGWDLGVPPLTGVVFGWRMHRNRQ